MQDVQTLSITLQNAEDQHPAVLAGSLLASEDAVRDFQTDLTYRQRQFPFVPKTWREYSRIDVPSGSDSDDDPLYLPPSSTSVLQEVTKCKRKCDCMCDSKFNPDAIAALTTQFATVGRAHRRFLLQAMCLVFTRIDSVVPDGTDLETNDASRKRSSRNSMHHATCRYMLYKTIVGVMKLHHFEYRASEPGFVHYKELPDSTWKKKSVCFGRSETHRQNDA